MMDGDSSASRGLVRASSECIVDKAAADRRFNDRCVW
jgi:hypothetical protein